MHKLRFATNRFSARLSARFSAGIAMAALLGLALATTAAQAQWKWRDANGQVHASDLPPPRGIADKNILQRPATRQPAAPANAQATPAGSGVGAAPAAAASAASAPGGATAQANKPAPETELDRRRKAAEQEQQAKAKAEEDVKAGKRRENCGRARAHATTLESGIRIARSNAQGEREFLDDAARADELRRTREVIKADCV